MLKLNQVVNELDKIYSIEEIQKIVEPIAKRHGVHKVYLFGSYARGEATEKSDIDLRIESGKIKSLFGLGGLYAELEEALAKPLDIVTSEALAHRVNCARTASFQNHIRKDEHLLYEEKR